MKLSSVLTLGIYPLIKRLKGGKEAGPAPVAAAPVDSPEPVAPAPQDETPVEPAAPATSVAPTEPAPAPEQPAEETSSENPPAVPPATV